ncbi:MAG: transcription termination factor NusA, partial [Oscillospiraceae bacterium]|nr:transcription termination factor NusA [Oscillospiraceae bacterium]
ANVIKVEPASGNATLEINGSEVMLFKGDQIPDEEINQGDIIKVYVSGVSANDRRPTLKISRTHKELVKRLFELEVPEIYDGVVEVRAVSREPGQRSKMAVISNDPNVDAVGSCIGPSRSRVSRICNELCGEKIDIITWSEDPKEFIKQALRPAEVVDVDIPDEEIRACAVTVPDNQLSLAIGNKGQNAKLAARLTGFKIDIKPESGFFEQE